MTKRRADETPFEKLYKRLVAMVVTRLYSTAVTDGDDETRQAIITTASLLVSRRGDGYECGRDELLRILTDPKRGLDTKMVTRRVLHDNLVAHGFVKVETRYGLFGKMDWRMFFFRAREDDRRLGKFPCLRGRPQTGKISVSMRTTTDWDFFSGLWSSSQTGIFSVSMRTTADWEFCPGL